MLQTPPPTADVAAPCPHEDAVAQDARLLGRLAALGERLAEIVVADADACQQSDALTPGLNKLFHPEKSCQGLESVGRFVRRCLALKHRFLREQTEQGRIPAGRRIEQAEARRIRIRDRHLAVGTAMMKAVRADGYSDDSHERLFNDLYDRLERLTDSEVELSSLGGIVKRLCNQLSVPFDPMMFTSQDWAVEEIIKRPAGSPYADPHWDRPAPIPGRLDNLTLHGAATVRDPDSS
jgi:hypothetical protein